MKNLKYALFLFLSILLSLTLWSVTVSSASPTKEVEKGGAGPMVINSDMLEADDKKKTIIFTGDVEAKRDDFTVYCQKMVIYYEKSPEKKEAGQGSAKIEKIVATGDVKIVRTEGGVATGEKAVYDQKDEKLVLTGNPLVKQGHNSVEGDRITLYLKEDRSVVESTQNKKVRAVIFPKQEKRQGR